MKKCANAMLSRARELIERLRFNSRELRCDDHCDLAHTELRQLGVTYRKKL